MNKIFQNSLPAFIVSLSFFIFNSVSLADDMDDVMDVLNAYIQTEADLEEQAKLIADDRLFIAGNPAWRQSNNEANMKMQIAVEKRRAMLDPDGLFMATMEDEVVRVYGGTAVASFYRSMNWRPSAEGVRNGQSNNTNRQLVTVVMVKQGRSWKIVHTHISAAS